MQEKYYRSTISSIPSDQSTFRNTNIPIFFSVELQNPKQEIPLVSEELVRCTGCHGYLNPYVEIIAPGLKWRCNLCETMNETRHPFTMKKRDQNECSQDPVYNREYNRTHYERKDLTTDVYEIEAPENFSLRTPESSTICVIIDISTESQWISVPATVVTSITEAIKSSEIPSSTKVSFIFYTDKTYILDINENITIVPTTTPILYTNSFLFSVDPNSEDSVLNIDWDSIIKYFDKIQTTSSSLLGPIFLANTMFKHGSFLIFNSVLPNFGDSKIDPNTKNNKYAEIAELLYRNSNTVNLFITSRSNVGLSIISVLPQYTGGSIYYYPNYDGSDGSSSSKLHHDILTYLESDTRNDCMSKIRMNEGITLSAMYSNSYRKGSNMFGFSSYSPAHVLNFSISPYNNLEKALYIQIAMVGVNKQRSKLIRVFNIMVPVTEGSLYSGIDQMALTHALILESFYYEKRSRNDGSKHLQKRFETIWKELKNEGGMLSEFMLFQLLVICSKKSIPLRPDVSTPEDFRAYYSYLYQNHFFSLVDCLIYPTLFQLGLETYEPLPLTISSISHDGIYVLDTGAAIFIYCGKEIPEGDILSICGSTVSGGIVFSPDDSELGILSSEIISEILLSRILMPRFVLVVEAENSIYTSVFSSYLYEDPLYGLPSYQEYTRECESIK